MAGAVASKQREIERFEFKRRDGARIKKADAEIIGRRIVEIKPDGEITPAEIVADARKKSSPLHRFFEWNNEAASDKWRLEQARHLLREIEITIHYAGGDREDVKAFHSVTNADGDRGYMSAPLTFGNRELSAQVVAAARKELEGWRRRYARYSALAKADDLIASAIHCLGTDDNPVTR